MRPIPVFSALIQRFSRFFPAVPAASRAFLTHSTTATPRQWLLDDAHLTDWHNWRRAFLANPRPWVLATPELASGIMDWAWLWQDQPLLNALERVLEQKPTDSPAWQAQRSRLQRPSAWLLVAGPQARQWQQRLMPVLQALPEALTLFVMPQPVARAAPERLDWREDTAAVLCRGLECSSPIRDLDYLLETLQDG